MRACPHCSREIQEEAIKCRHCHREVEPPMWLASMRRCAHCAEWIELGREKCPYCDSVMSSGSPERTAPFVESSLDELVGGLRQEAEAGPALRDDLGRFGRGLGEEHPKELPDRREADLRAGRPSGERSWQADLAAEAQSGGRSWESEAVGGRSREVEPVSERSGRRRSWESDLEDEQPGGLDREVEPEVEVDGEQPLGRHSWEAKRELQEQPAAPQPKERKLGPFRLGRKEAKPEPEPIGPVPLFVEHAGPDEAHAAMRVEAEQDRPGFAALPPSRRRETSSFPQSDREALLSEEGAGAGGRGRRLAAALARTLIGLFVVGSLGVGGFLLVRGPGAPLLARLLATEVPATLTPSPVPTNTLSRAPTLPPESPEANGTSGAVVATQPAGPEGCVSWEQVTVANEGEQMCVYGEIRRWFAVDEVPFVAIFSEESGTFAFVDRLGVHSVGPGACVMGSGVVEVMRGTRPNIDVQGNLLPCPSG